MGKDKSNKRDKENFLVEYDLIDEISAPVNVGDGVGVSQAEVKHADDRVDEQETQCDQRWQKQNRGGHSLRSFVTMAAKAVAVLEHG